MLLYMKLAFLKYEGSGGRVRCRGGKREGLLRVAVMVKAFYMASMSSTGLASLSLSLLFTSSNSMSSSMSPPTKSTVSLILTDSGNSP